MTRLARWLVRRWIENYHVETMPITIDHEFQRFLRLRKQISATPINHSPSAAECAAGGSSVR